MIINVLEGGRRVGYLHNAKYEKKGVFRRVLTVSLPFLPCGQGDLQYAVVRHQLGLAD